LKNETKVWKRYGKKFWTLFSSIYLILMVAGIIMLAYSIYSTISNGWDWSHISFGMFGLIGIVASSFSMNLLPAWAELIRETRLMNEKMSGIIGSASVSQYIQADEERNKALIESIERKQNDVGLNLAKRIDSMKLEINRRVDTSTQLAKSVQDSLKQFTDFLSELSSSDSLDRMRIERARLQRENEELRRETGMQRIERERTLDSEENPEPASEVSEPVSIAENEIETDVLPEVSEEETVEVERDPVEEPEQQRKKDVPDVEEDNEPLGFMSKEDEESWGSDEEDEDREDDEDDSETEPDDYW
jgi:hypothetical protein